MTYTGAGSPTDWEGTPVLEGALPKVSQAERGLHPKVWLRPLNTTSNPVLSKLQPLATGGYLNLKSLKCIHYFTI